MLKIGGISHFISCNNFSVALHKLIPEIQLGEICLGLVSCTLPPKQPKMGPDTKIDFDISMYAKFHGGFKYVHGF